MINLLPGVLLAILFSFACNSDYYPKPRGYFRIDLPEHEYQSFDTTFPYKFEYPVYASILEDPLTRGNQYWINVDFEQFRGKVHLSYKAIDGNLNEYLEDTRTLAMKHIPKASGIKTETFVDENAKVYGLTYSIDGVEAASPYQFYLTDSTNHFIRGALYFNVVPNNDSLSPVIEFLKEDIRHMIETFEWRDR
jgi:gliding motility-associated lipoprotein GldD